MPASQSDLFKKAGASTVTTLSAPGKALGATSLTVGSTTNYPSDTGIIIAIRVVDTAGKLVNGTYTEWSATVTSGTSLSINATPVYGSDQIYAAGSTTQVFIPVSSYSSNKLIDGILEEHKQTGKHGDITADSAVITNATITNLTVGSQTTPNDYTSQAILPTSVAYNGQGSYTLTYPSSVASFKSPGQRNRIVRTVAAPTQSTSLNGTNQYWVKTSPNKLTFTDDFVVDAYVKLTSYAAGAIASRLDATQGWNFIVSATGQIQLAGFNGGYGNSSIVTSYQSIPLNKWVRVTAQLDMSTFTATPTTSYIMIDGVDVPATVTRTGTLPTSLVQVGNLQIGGQNGTGTLFTGKIAQVAIYNAKVTQANIRLTHSQGLTGSETSLASAYSFNGVATDLNITTPNDLTAMNSAGYATDSPFGNSGVSSTVEYAMTQSVSSDGLTEVMQAPEGCTIPTSGGITSMSYSGLSTPYGFPQMSSILLQNESRASQSGITTETDLYFSIMSVYVPQGVSALKLSFHCGSFVPTVGTDRATVTMKDGATVIMTDYVAPGTTIGNPLDTQYIIQRPTVGFHTFKVVVTRVTGTGSFLVYGDTTTPSYFSAEICKY